MKTKYLFLFFLFASCATSFSKKVYRSVNGEQLTLTNKNSFDFTDVIAFGHSDLYVKSKGTYTIQKDTIWLTHIDTNADSLYVNGKQIIYELPAFVTRNEQGDIFLLKGGSKKMLQRSPYF